MFPLQFLISFLAFFANVYCTPVGLQGAKLRLWTSAVSNPNVSNIISGKYIIVYHNNATVDAVQTHQTSVMTAMWKRGLKSKMRMFSMMGWRAMTLRVDDGNGMIMDIANADEVAYVEADTIVKTTALLSQSSATPGLARISHGRAGNSTYVFDSTAGSGIVAFVVDTGILVTHAEFQGRTTFGANFANTVNTDENGHGSHVAGTIGGKTFGVAKSVSLVAVKVLDADGSGTNSDTIAGLQWVMKNVTEQGFAGKAVVNLSLGGPKSNALNAAIAALTRAGVTVVVAAGNDNQNAANESPASAPSAITVGAIDASTDTKASFSNFGASVDIMAPGVNVQSVGIKSNTDVATLSGTSMASPHVAGMAAYLMSLEGLTTVAAITSRIQALARTTGAATKNQNIETTTLIAYNGNGF